MGGSRRNQTQAEFHELPEQVRGGGGWVKDSKELGQVGWPLPVLVPPAAQQGVFEAVSSPASGKSSSFDILLLPFSPALSLLSPLEQPGL